MPQDGGDSQMGERHAEEETSSEELIAASPTCSQRQSSEPMEQEAGRVGVFPHVSLFSTVPQTEQPASNLSEAAQAMGEELRTPNEAAAQKKRCRAATLEDALRALAEYDEKDGKLCRMQAQALQALAEELRGEFANDLMLLRMEIQQAQLSFAAALQVQRKDFEGVITDLRQEIEHEKPLLQQQESSEDARIRRIEHDIAKLCSQTEELENGRRALKRDHAETTKSVRRELVRLTELTVGCLSRVGDMPTELESLREDVRALQQLRGEQPASVQQHVEQIQQQHSPQHAQQDSPGQGPTSQVHDAIWRKERKAISQEMATVRVEILRAKDLFLSGQTSAGLVLKDLELLRQDVSRLSTSLGPP